MSPRRAGFTFVELLIAMTIVGILSSIAVPKYIDLKRRASTTKVLGDFQVVRVAVMNFYADSSYFPPEVAGGVVPPSLAKYLPIGFKFRNDDWSLDYEKWDLGPQPGFTSSTTLVAIAVVTKDPRLAAMTSGLLGDVAGFGSGSRYTFLISGM